VRWRSKEECSLLDVEVTHVERVVFDELASRFDSITHQD
jgi:hypothetical protein